MKTADLTQIRAHISELIRELGMAVHSLEEAAAATRQHWGPQVAADLNQAADAARMVTEHATRIERTVEKLAVIATKKAKGGAS